MRKLSKTELLTISGGYASITKNGDFLVTNSSKLSINGIVFDSKGKIYDDLTGYVYFQYTEAMNVFFHKAHQNRITATPTIDGFLYRTEENYQHIF